MIRIHEIKLRPGESESKLPGRVERRLGIPKGSVSGVTIAKESLDARDKPDIYRVFSLDVYSELPDSTLLLAAKNRKVKAGEVREEKYSHPCVTRIPAQRPVVCGFGPCGIFAALTYVRCGFEPLIIERGASMEERVAAVEAFWEGGPLDSAANVQFGEGGAGTFSDGKLTTGTKDPAQRLVLETFVDAGASPSILYRQRPHIGTDVLRRAVAQIREYLRSKGAEFRFRTELTDLDIEGGRLKGIYLSSQKGDEYIECDTLVMGLGHSARDSFRMLYSRGFLMEQKPFSMGVRIEHRQEFTDMTQYGALSSELGIGPADYKLAVKTSSGRGVYTFCMCPGGYVVASASGEGQVVTNGMSNSGRDGDNSNSALLVDILPADFGSQHPLAGVEFQEKYEHLAFELGGGNYFAPAQRTGDFLRSLGSVPAGQNSNNCSRHSFSGNGNDTADVVRPTYRPGVTMTDIKDCLPDFVASSIAEALPLLDMKMKGFANPSSVMTAIESRSSSPVRTKRDSFGRALSADGGAIEGIYPAGEGAGYAGGIMSSAVDGIHAAERSLCAANDEQVKK